MILLGIAMFIFVFAIALIVDVQLDLRKEQKEDLSKDFLISLQKELEIAKESAPGYARSFNVPQDIDGVSYDIRSTSCEDLYDDPYEAGQAGRPPGNVEYMRVGEDLELRTPSWDDGNLIIIRQVAPHKGTFIKGQLNTIQNVDGKVYVNGILHNGVYEFAESCWCEHWNEVVCDEVIPATPTTTTSTSATSMTTSTLTSTDSETEGADEEVDLGEMT